MRTNRIVPTPIFNLNLLAQIFLRGYESVKFSVVKAIYIVDSDSGENKDFFWKLQYKTSESWTRGVAISKDKTTKFFRLVCPKPRSSNG